jgi:hypothetical protein
MARKQLMALLAGTAGLASAAAQADPVDAVDRRFDAADAVVIENFVGQVTLRRGDAIRISLSTADEGGPVDVTQSGGAVEISGDRRLVRELFDGRESWRGGGWSRSSDHMRQRFAEFLGDYPTLEVTLPESAALTIDGGGLIVTGETALGRLRIGEARRIYANLGDVEEAMIAVSGTGDIVVGNVAELAEVKIGGSGDVVLGDVGRAAFRIGGSGDIDAGDVAGTADLTIGGSGDIDVRRVGGAATLSIGGSGDIDVASVEDGVEMSIGGSGDITVRRVAGRVEARINGSGEIDLGEGTADSFLARINGSGDLEFGGTANDPDVAVTGSGDLEIAEATGEVKVSGRQPVKIGGRVYNKRR